MKVILNKITVVLLSGMLAITGIFTGYHNNQAANNSGSIAYLLGTAPKDNSKASTINDSYDIFFMDDDASFKYELADGVYWVPVNVLGKPQYSSEKLRKIIDTRDPAFIEKKINTLYDAISYRYLSGFTTTRGGDHKDLPFNGVIWQHHKDGKEAVLTNEGDCSGNAVLISYLLKGNYKESGYISYNLSNGSGHVFNYFMHKGSYYFIDCTEMRSAIMESNLSNRWSDFGVNLIMADSVQQFIDYYTMNYINGAAVFQMYQDERVAPIGYKNDTYYLPNDLKIRFYGDTDQIKYILTKGPTDIPSWENSIQKAINRNLTGELSIVPYSHSEYEENRGDFYDLRLYNLNGIPVQLQHLTINYYDKSGKLLSKEKYTSDDFNNIMINNVVFDMAMIGLNNSNNTARIDGSVEYLDINGHLERKEFKFDLSARDIPVEYVQ